MPETLPQGGVSEGAGPEIYNYRLFGRSSRDTEQKPEDASMTEGIGGSRGRSGKAVPAAGENVILGGRHARDTAAGRRLGGCRARNLQLSQALSAAQARGCNYRRLFRQVLPGYRAQARGCIHDGRNWGLPGKIGEGCARSRRKCNIGGPACPRHCRRAASRRVPGPEFTIIAGSFGRSSRDTEHKPEDASMGGSRGREWPQPKKM